MFVPDQPTILHADLDAFYASVEQRDRPDLRGKPVIVGGGVVLSASYEARARGVRTAMGGGQARRLCPRAVVVSPRISAYVDASRAVFAVFAETAPVVEALSIDEAFLDVSGLERISGTPLEIAAALRAEVRQTVGLPITVGIARTKFLAKVASGVAKPDGLLLVPSEHELEFLHPLAVERLWGVGKVTGSKLRAQGILTVGQVAALPEAELIRMVGRAAGRQLHALAHNRDARRVRPRRRRRSIGSQSALGRRPRPPEEIASILMGIVDRVTRRLRASRRACRTVILRLRFADFSRCSRSHTVAEPTALTSTIASTACELLAAAQPAIAARGLTLIGITLTNLVSFAPTQLSLDAPPGRRDERRLDATLDRVRDRFGTGSVTRAALVGREQHPSVPLLPD
jgi:DNA polymerase-4